MPKTSRKSRSKIDPYQTYITPERAARRRLGRDRRDDLTWRKRDQGMVGDWLNVFRAGFEAPILGQSTGRDSLRRAA